VRVCVCVKISWADEKRTAVENKENDPFLDSYN
jgi:hypothetical protein